MGVSLTYVAVPNNNSAEVLEKLSLKSTGESNAYPQSLISGVDLNNGWYVIVVNKYESKLFATNSLQQISHSCEIYIGMAEDHVVHSYAAGWRHGKQIWFVLHKGDEGDLSHLEHSGDLPAEFPSIEERFRAMQKEEEEKQGENACDNIFTIPEALFHSLTGFSYDEDPKGLGDKPFEVLKQK